MTRAVIYTRVSTEEQTNGYGLEVQRERTRAQITAKGWEYIGEYTDEGISGTLSASERPGLQALIDDGCNGVFDAVIVLALDRLGRKTALVLETVDNFRACGIDVVSCKEALDTTTPQGQFVLTIFAGLAQLERDTIVERTTAGRNARGKVDGEKGGRVPLGYIRTDDGVSVDPEGAKVVNRIFSQRRNGATLTAIADTLNSEGITTARGKQWHASSVKEVLNNEDKYTGGYRGESLMQWERIIQ